MSTVGGTIRVALAAFSVVAFASPPALAADPPGESAQPAASAGVPIRRARRAFALGEFGWNSLAGMGVNAGYHVLPHLTAEAGFGFSLVRWKLGARLRANLLEGAWTPFLAAGAMISTGESTEQVFPIGGRIAYTIRPSPFAQLVAGVDYTGGDGVTFLATLGWAFLLSPNVDVTSGLPSPTQQRYLDLAFGSGPVAAIALGYSF